jgi:hypothetical protein
MIFVSQPPTAVGSHLREMSWVRSPVFGRWLPHLGQGSHAAFWMDLGVELPDFGEGIGMSGLELFQDSAGGLDCGLVLRDKRFKRAGFDSLMQ